MLASLQRQLCQIIVRVRSRGDDDDIHVRVLDQIIGGAVCLDARMILLRVIARLRISLHNGIELEVRHGGDEGDVKDFGAEAVADDADVPRSRHDEGVPRRYVISRAVSLGVPAGVISTSFFHPRAVFYEAGHRSGVIRDLDLDVAADKSRGLWSF